MRLIDADELIEDIKNHLWDWEAVTTVLKQTISDIKKQPSIKAIPIEWLRMWFTKKASLIGITLMSEIESDWEKENEIN